MYAGLSSLQCLCLMYDFWTFRPQVVSAQDVSAPTRAPPRRFGPEPKTFRPLSLRVAYGSSFLHQNDVFALLNLATAMLIQNVVITELQKLKVAELSPYTEIKFVWFYFDKCGFDEM